MAGKGLVFRLMFLLSFIITIISAASLQSSTQRTNDRPSPVKRGCITLPSECYGTGAPGVNIFVANCIGGECGPCRNAPSLFCVIAAGNCTSPGGASYGVCVPACECYGF